MVVGIAQSKEEKYETHCQVKSITFIAGTYNVSMVNPVLGSQETATPLVPVVEKRVVPTLIPDNLGVNAKEAHLIGKHGSLDVVKCARILVRLDAL